MKCPQRLLNLAALHHGKPWPCACSETTFIFIGSGSQSLVTSGNYSLLTPCMNGCTAPNQNTLNSDCSMTTFQEVEQAIKTWNLGSLIVAKRKGGKTELTVNGATAVFPNWLAVQKINQVGAEHGV